MEEKKYPKAIVGGLIYNSRGELFLMQSFGKYQDQWIVPGGKVDWGESVQVAFIREVREETNLQIENVEFLGIRELIEPERHFIFLEHQATAKNANDVKLNEEAQHFGWFTQQTLNTINIAPPTRDLINTYGWR